MSVQDKTHRDSRNGITQDADLKHGRWHRLFPVLHWLQSYSRDMAVADLVAGAIVAVLLVPQGMAYAFMAGLPPHMGLYAGIVPLLLYALFGSSRTLAVGPVAIASLMVGEALMRVAVPGTERYLLAAMTLAFLSGVLLLLMRLLRMGRIVNFLSHSVITGFTSAAALTIAFSQVKHLLGLELPRGESVFALLQQLPQFNTATLVVAALAWLALWFTRRYLAGVLARLRLPQALIGALVKAGPMFAVALGILLVWGLALDRHYAVATVGAIPAGLPSLTGIPLDLAWWRELLPSAALIALVGYLESVSVGTALASKERERIDPNQELMALGAANLGAAFTGAYPVAGGFGRSMVNFASGARTTIASMITALLLALTVTFLMPLFQYLPKAVLGVVVIAAVLPLIDLSAIWRTWRFNRADSLTLLATFLAVLVLGVEIGILTGVVLSIALLLQRSSQPHIAELGRVGDSEHFRNIKRHPARTNTHILMLRIDENLYFANAGYIEDAVLSAVAERPPLRHVVLVCSAISFMDASALDTLENLVEHLRDAGVTLHLAEVKGPVMDQLMQTDFRERLAPGGIFFTPHEAMRTLEAELNLDRT